MQLFLDMDGVLADFDRGYWERFGVRPSKHDDQANAVDWDLVRRTPGFYRELPPMHDFHELWDYAKRFDPIVLTGVPASVAGAASNKREWVDKWLGKDVPMIGCRSRDKSLHMKAKGDVLVDDWEKYRELWIAAGGRWITHTSARKSILDLSDLLVGW